MMLRSMTSSVFSTSRQVASQYCKRGYWSKSLGMCDGERITLVRTPLHFSLYTGIKRWTATTTTVEDGNAGTANPKFNELRDKVTHEIDTMEKDAALLKGVCNWERMREECTQLAEKLGESSLWEKTNGTECTSGSNRSPTTSDPISLQKRHAKLSKDLADYDEAINNFEGLKELAEIAIGEKDSSMLSEVGNDLSEVGKALRSITFRTAMDDPQDINGCFVELRAGAGGTESCYWVDLVAKMYKGWGDRKGYKVSITDEVPDEISGYKTLTLNISGEYAFGWLKHETGVHRFIRRSKFDQMNRRHTSFVSVTVTPDLGPDETADVEIPTKDLLIEVMRSQGAGGQHVNKTESAVRLTHIPTGTTVFCQQERSQHQNRAQAMEWLKAKLANIKREADAKEKADEHASKLPPAWGSQIRTYTIHPQQMVKDSRTGFGALNAEEVLNGDLDAFLENALLEITSFRRRQ